MTPFWFLGYLHGAVISLRILTSLPVIVVFEQEEEQ